MEISEHKTNVIDPARVFTPKGFKRVKRGDKLRQGDLFLHCGLFKWYPVSLMVQENHYTNCIRPVKPVALLSEHTSV